MKKLLLVFGILCSGLVFSQMSENDINIIIKEVNKYSQTTNDFKTGDHDMPLVKGMLKYIFDDPQGTVDRMIEMNPRIGQLNVGKVDKTISFDKWILLLNDPKYHYDPQFYRVDYSFQYLGDNNGGEPRYAEKVLVIDIESDQIIRYIKIYYNSDNLRCILDSEAHKDTKL